MGASRSFNGDGNNFMYGQSALLAQMQGITQISILNWGIYNPSYQYYPLSFSDSGSKDLGFFPYSGNVIYLDCGNGSTVYGYRPVSMAGVSSYTRGHITSHLGNWYQCTALTSASVDPVGNPNWKLLGAVGSIFLHFAMVYNGGETGDSNRMKLYLNGVQHELAFFGTVPASLAGDYVYPPEIGRIRVSPRYDGSMQRHSHTHLYKRAMSIAEVQENMHRCRARFPNQLAYWNMYGNTTTHGAVGEIDKSGNGHDILISTSAYTSSSGPK